MRHLRAFVDFECAKVMAVGGTGFVTQFANSLNEWIKVAIGLASFFYVIVKIRKEMKKK